MGTTPSPYRQPCGQWYRTVRFYWTNIGRVCRVRPHVNGLPFGRKYLVMLCITRSTSNYVGVDAGSRHTPDLLLFKPLMYIFISWILQRAKHLTKSQLLDKAGCRTAHFTYSANALGMWHNRTVCPTDIGYYVHGIVDISSDVVVVLLNNYPAVKSIFIGTSSSKNTNRNVVYW